MRRTRTLMKVLLLATLFLPVVVQMVAQGTLSVVSNADPNDPLPWNVIRMNPSPSPPTFLLLPQNVCLNATNPLMCSMGVTPAPTEYGWPFSGGWAAIVSNPTGARWIWAPNITGTTTPANLQEFTFEKDFYLCDPPTGGTLYIAADNFAEVTVNTTVLSPTSSSADQLTTYTIPAMALYGSSFTPIPTIRPNKLTIKARNGEGCNENNYQCNPAGILVGATFTFMGTGECNGYNNIKYKTGSAETLGSCPAGQIGPGIRRLCVCGSWLPSSTSCFTPPPPVTCPGATRPFNVGEMEMQSCPAGQTATPSSHTCQSNGMWDRPLGPCVAPPVTCPGLTGPVPVNTTEIVACPPGQTASPARTRTCTATGQWAPTVGGPCIPIPPPPPPILAAGAMCATNRGTNILGTCPAGTTCASRLGPSPPKSFWCAVFGIDCRPRLQTTDWFCDP